MVIKMKRYMLAAGLAAVIALALLAQAGDMGGIWKKWSGEDTPGMERMHHTWMKHRDTGKMMRKNLLNMEREEGVLSYKDGKFYVGSTQVYFGDRWWLNHTIRSDYDGDGEYEIIWNELNGLLGKEIVVNGIYDNGTIIASHINGIFLRMPFKAEFVQINGVIEEHNGSFYIDTYKIVTRKKLARSDYDGDELIEGMIKEISGLCGKEVSVDGYLFGDKILLLHINGIEI